MLCPGEFLLRSWAACMPCWGSWRGSPRGRSLSPSPKFGLTFSIVQKFENTFFVGFTGRCTETVGSGGGVGHGQGSSDRGPRDGDGGLAPFQGPVMDQKT